MNLSTFRMLWKSYPYGWSIRSMDTDGNFQAELLLSSPPFRCLHSGYMRLEDVNEIVELAKQSLFHVDSEPKQESTGYVGFLTMSLGQDAEENIPIYYFYPKEDCRASTKAFVQIVFIFDKYLHDRVEFLATNSDIWDQIDPSDLCG